MKRMISLIALALVAAFAVSVVGAAGASAAPVWQECKNVGAEGKFETNQCAKEGGKKEFDWREITVATKVTSSGTLKLTDLKGGIFGEAVTVECTGTDAGTVGPGGKDEITAITATSCKVVKGICPTPITATALNLPWQTQLEEPVKGEIRDKITTKAGTKEVGWELNCGGTVDKCLATSSSTSMKNNADGTVTATFDSKTPKANCSRGGTGQGEVIGTSTNKSTSGAAIRVH